MLLRPKLAGLFVTLMASAALLFSGCSSSSPHDININTDVGVGFVPPDATAATAAHDVAIDVGSAVEAAGEDAGETADETAKSADGGVSEVSIDGEVPVDGAIDGAS